MSWENAPCVVSGYRFPDGTVEGTAFIPRARGKGKGQEAAEVDQEEQEKSPEQVAFDRVQQEEKEKENRHRGARLARQTMQRKIRSADCRKLLTFTNGQEGGDGFDSLRDGLRSWWRWYLHGGQELLNGSSVVAVAERGGKYGRVHLHVAVRVGWYDYGAIRASWSAHLEAAGYHSATGVHRFHAGDDSGQHAGGFHSARTCALYMAGYLSKSLLDPTRVKGERRFEADGCQLPAPDRFYGLRLGEVPSVMRDTFDSCSCKAFRRPDTGEVCGYWFDSGAPPDEGAA